MSMVGRHQGIQRHQRVKVDKIRRTNFNIVCRVVVYQGIYVYNLACKTIHHEEQGLYRCHSINSKCRGEYTVGTDGGAVQGRLPQI